MNIHNTKLPPLPKLPMKDPAAAHKILNDYGKACANAAIKADRQRRGEPVKAPSDEELYELAESMDAVIVCNGEGDYNDNEDSVVNYARAVLARYGHPVEPEGWQLVPVELTRIMMYAGVAEWLTRDDPEEDVQGIWEAMLEAAPKFGEEK